MTHSPIGILGVAGVLLLAAAGGYWWLNQATTVPVSSVVGTSLEHDTKLAVDLDNKLDGVISDTELNNLNVLEDDSHTIPPDVIDTPIIAETTVEEGKRVVVPSELVDSLVGDSEDVLEQEDVTVKNEPSDVTAGTVKEDPITESEVKQGSSSNITFSLANRELKDISQKRYILQLAALTNEEAVQEFLTEHQIEKSARIYQALRNGSIWYIVTFGDYASISAARGAVQTLPSSVQSLGPWAKSLVQVHREIDSVK